METWKQQIDRDMETIQGRLGEMDVKLKEIENSDKSEIDQILTAIKELGDTKQKDSRWKSFGLFLLGGMSFLSLIVLLAVLSSYYGNTY